MTLIYETDCFVTERSVMYNAANPAGELPNETGSFASAAGLTETFSSEDDSDGFFGRPQIRRLYILNLVRALSLAVPQIMLIYSLVLLSIRPAIADDKPISTNEMWIKKSEEFDLIIDIAKDSREIMSFMREVPENLDASIFEKNLEKSRHYVLSDNSFYKEQKINFYILSSEHYIIYMSFFSVGNRFIYDYSMAKVKKTDGDFKFKSRAEVP